MAMTRAGCVYVATNLRNGSRYVGQTVQPLRKRVQSHISHAKNAKFVFQRAICEHGADAFDFVEFFTAFDRQVMNDVERTLIAELHPEYNATAGGAGTRGRVCSDETRALRSAAAKKRWANPEWRANTVEALRKANTTPEAVARGRRLQQYGGSAIRWAGHTKPVRRTRAEIDYSAQARKVWAEHRDKIIAGLRAANERDGARERRRNAMLGRIMPLAAVEASAKAKWKPVYCPEMQFTFLSQKAAAEYFGVWHTSISNAIKQKGKVKSMFSLVKVA